MTKSKAKGPVIIYTQGWGRRENGWVAKTIWPKGLGNEKIRCSKGWVKEI